MTDIKKYFVTVIFFILSFSMLAQNPNRFFPQKDLMVIGTYYYPEQWPTLQWERDLKRIAELGFEFTHFGEFAWGLMEPEEGKFDFEWLDEAVRIADKHGLKVIMCTPSAAPPAWLSYKHPDVLLVDENGTTIQHGGRQHTSWSSDTYLEYVEKIVSELAKRYGNNKAVWGWQIDNEPSHQTAPYDYSENAQKKFRLWLEKKYKSIDTLNEVWGNTFWSQKYNNFEQILIPNQKELTVKANPHTMLDFKRFQADEAAHFINLQNDVLRKYISEDQWITTNAVPSHTAVDPKRMDHLDFVTYTRYLVKGYSPGYGKNGFRIGDIRELGYSNDVYRNYKGISAVMEIQPGQINWGKFNPQTYPGAIRLWLYHIFAGGNKFVCNYRFRQPLKGSEQYHYGIMQTDGISLSSTGKEFIQTIEEMKLLRAEFDTNAKMPESYAKKRTAILLNPDNEWEMDFQPQTNQWKFRNHVLKYYDQLKSLVVPVDVVEESDKFENYPVVLAPAYQLLDKKLVERWKQYVTNGGHLILTCRTGQKNREGHLWEQKLSEPIYELAGIKELFYDHLPSSEYSKVSFEDKNYTWNNWADVLSADKDIETWAEYKDQFYAGKAAVTHKKLNKGSVTYIGIDSDDGKLEKAVLKKVYDLAGAKTEDLPEGVVIEWRDGFWVGLNYNSDPQEIPIPNNAKILIGEKKLQPTGVVVWTTK